MVAGRSSSIDSHWSVPCELLWHGPVLSSPSMHTHGPNSSALPYWVDMVAPIIFSGFGGEAGGAGREGGEGGSNGGSKGGGEGDVEGGMHGGEGNDGGVGGDGIFGQSHVWPSASGSKEKRVRRLSSAPYTTSEPSAAAAGSPVGSRRSGYCNRVGSRRIDPSSPISMNSVRR